MKILYWNLEKWTNRLLVYGFLVIVLGCSKSNDFHDKIKGEWVSESPQQGKSNKIIVFTFQDDLCSYIMPYFDFSHYEIHNDSLIINQRIESRKKGRILTGDDEYIFKIHSINSDELVMSPLSKLTKDPFHYNILKSVDTIKLFKVKPKSNIEIDRIAFFSSTCRGHCPSMYLEIDNNGNILFQGGYLTINEGGFFGKISDLDWKLIKRKVNSIQWDSLKKSYASSWSKVQSFGILIQSGNVEYETMVYGYDDEPIELQILFHQLMEVYKNVDLVEDKSIKNKFKFSSFEEKRSAFDVDQKSEPDQNILYH